MTPITPDTFALLIVDLQNDFLAPQGAYARGGIVCQPAQTLPARVASVAHAVKESGGMVVASQFTLWPDARGEPMVSSHLRILRPFLRRGDFAPGSQGHALAPELAEWVDTTVHKVAYSAFFQTQLNWILRHAGINTVAVCGIVTQGGVASTVRDAHLHEYRTLVLSDGCTAFQENLHLTALADMGSIAEVMTCASLLSSLPHTRS